MDARLAEFADVTLEEADLTARYIGASLAAMRSFDVFAALSMFYFAAASFTEMARRLDSRVAPRRFLASDDAAFLEGLRRAIGRVGSGRAFAAPTRFERTVARATERRNVAGLCDPDKRNWYGVDLEDVVRGAAKLALTPDRVRSWALTAM
jgi:FADH2 O2-dependent halogenase